MNKAYSLLLFLLMLPAPDIFSQVTVSDYARVDTLWKSAERVYNAGVRPSWIEKSHTFWFMNHEKEGDFYYLVNAETGKKIHAFDQEKLAAILEKETGKKPDFRKLPLRDVNFASKDEMTFSVNNVSYKYNIRKNKLSKQEDTDRRGRRREGRWGGHKDTAKVISPDKKWEAYIKDNNIYVRALDKREPMAITQDGVPGWFYSSRIIWSPDSKKLATLRVREVEERRIPLIESAPESQKQPILQWRNYAKPGDVLSVSLPVLFNIEEGKQVSLDADLYANQFALYLTGWRNDSRAFTFEFNERGHQRYIVGEVDAVSGEIVHMADEKTKTFIHYYKNYRFDLQDGKEMLWISERDGWRHIYMLDDSGNVKRQITKGEWVVRTVEYVDEANRLIYFTASGLNTGEDPYNIHYCRIGFDGNGFTDLTPENGNHQAYFSKDYTYFVDVYSRPDLPHISQVKRLKDGSLVAEVQRCDISELLTAGWQMPEVFHAKGRDGKTDIWGNIHRPSDFDPSKTYPVVEMIYAGPHDSHVEKNFIPYNRLISRLADLGFIIVSIDGMGTSNRSKAFHDVCWKNLKDAGFPDRKLWIKAAAEKYAYMDISSVGIYGWSAGGQNAMAALLFHNDFYKTAVAFCGCHDNRMDKIWWNEQWMGYPLDDSYSASSNVDNAHLLKGNLMLVNGELDDNVDPTSTLQVVSALMKANKKFEQLYLPGKGHALGGTYELQYMYDFFVKHLLGQAPPQWGN